MNIDVYHPLVASDHRDSCASLCTDYSDEPDRGCSTPHECWCPDGGLTYAKFRAKHPDMTVAEA